MTVYRFPMIFFLRQKKSLQTGKRRLNKGEIVHLSKEIPDDVLTDAVEAKDYHVVGIA